MKPFAERSGKEKAVELLRWVLVPCVGILIGLANSPFITELLMWPFIEYRIVPLSHAKVETSRRLLAGIVLGAAFVVVGAKMAPRARVMTALFLGILWPLYWLYSDVLVAPWQDGLSYVRAFIATLSAAGGATYIVRSEKRRTS